MSYVHFYACFLNAPLLNKYHDNTRVIILLWKLRVKNFSKIVVEAILDFRSEHSIQLQVFLRHRASFLLFSFHWSYRGSCMAFADPFSPLSSVFMISSDVVPNSILCRILVISVVAHDL
ncbi:uncharacterized protein LOC107797163 isoform X2 [Nicotiana tabacum]|uniref:Uncharacterized protein LOC107797163 isoform X2 n=2 Tax=Nicotiana tabacum TaxID=4097 RepID=A0AC58RT46_TOBAC